jgi:methylated-DNA-[protein]-cysteine S-methyltransferase
MSRDEIIESKYLDWLDGAEGKPAPDGLAETLDSLYAAGPGLQATNRALGALRAALTEAGPSMVFYDQIEDSPIGPLFLAVSERGVVGVGLIDSEEAFVSGLRKRVGVDPERSPEQVASVAEQLREYLAGKRSAFELQLDLSSLTGFQRQVLQAVSKIPRGEVTTYANLAREIGRPKAVRAVGRALGSNPIPIVIPCHRVLASDGSLRGYSGRGGVETKAKLLRLEGALP